ncbi:DoxX family protein [Gordonia sp. NPDC003425]
MANQPGAGKPQSNTGSGGDAPESRPISVAELLARRDAAAAEAAQGRGSAEGRRSADGRGRRRAGRDGAVSVSELTGEIPRITTDPAPATPVSKTPAPAPQTSRPATPQRETPVRPAWGNSQPGPFPRSSSPIARRASQDGPVPDTDTDTSASAFRGATPGDTPTPTRPSFRAPETRDFHAGAVASRLATPAAEQASDDLVEADLEHANAVTGIIPVVGDEPDGVSVVDADDVDSVELAAPPAPAGRTSAFAEVMDDDFEAYRAFADVEDDEEPKQKRRWFRRRGAKAAGRGAAAKAAAVADGTDAEAPTVDKATGPDVPEPATADFPGDEAVALTPAATEQFSAADREEATDASPAPGTPALEDPAIEAEENTSMELVEDLLDVQPAADDVIADSEAPVPATDTADVDEDVEGTESSSAAPVVDDVAGERVPTADTSAADTATADTSVTETAAAGKTDTADTHAPDTDTADTDTADTDTADTDTADTDTPDTDTAPAKKGRFDSPLAAWLLVIGESIVGLAVGVGLFWGFTELWKWNVYFALVLAVLVIFGVVTLTHAVRRSRDLPTTLLALGVGLIVTIGPLVLLAT